MNKGIFYFLLVIFFLSGCSKEELKPIIVNSNHPKESHKVEKKADVFSEYEIVSGDTYSKISKKANVSIEQLKKWNPDINSENLIVGDKLNISSDVLENINEDKVTYQPGFIYEKISKEIEQKITGKSYQSDAPVTIDDLRYVNLLYVDLQGKEQKGELIVNKYIAQDMVEIFYELHKKKYPIERMQLVEAYGADDELSMSDNNTSAFCYRPIEGSTETSYHSYGLAIDINPFVNPYVKNDIVLPKGATAFANRDKEKFNSQQAEMMIDQMSDVYDAFKSRGYDLGGDWEIPKDYQHFEKIIN